VAAQCAQVLGKGSYGKVMLVRYQGDGKLYAMKTLRKATLLRRNQVDHTKTERAVLQTVDHPFIVKLRFAFQVRDIRWWGAVLGWGK
jgi:serine/threonine protein kinase